MEGGSTVDNSPDDGEDDHEELKKTNSHDHKVDGRRMHLDKMIFFFFFFQIYRSGYWSREPSVK